MVFATSRSDSCMMSQCIGKPLLYRVEVLGQVTKFLTRKSDTGYKLWDSVECVGLVLKFGIGYKF